ncbi:MAG: GNAT family N-acetyltransferase [Pseudomonadota bacterium]|nr:GNAT family N-acetyltransferase [Pseudomonadota bacterium]
MAPVLPEGFAVRPLERRDHPRVVELDRLGTELLARHGYPVLLEEPPLDEAGLEADLQDCRAWVVADGRDMPAGYAMARIIEDTCWLCEMAVDPATGRRGLGSALLMQVAAHAQDMDCTGIGLSTFDDVPFNRPFYEKRGFELVHRQDLPQRVLDQVDDETPPGRPAGSRVIMMKFLATA